MRRSLNDNTDIARYYRDTFVSNAIKKDQDFNNYLTELINKKNSQGVDYFTENNINDWQFNSGDLLYAIHKYNADIHGIKVDDSWDLGITITDVFDFTEFKTPFNEDWRRNPLGWTGNDVAYIDQKFGLINPVDVEIKFNYGFGN